jgi:hypothetical protein
MRMNRSVDRSECPLVEVKPGRQEALRYCAARGMPVSAIVYTIEEADS